MNRTQLKHHIAPHPDLQSVVALLESCNLITADLTDDDMNNFMGCSDASGLYGVIGLQPCGENGLLRSLAVRPGMRGAGLGSELVTALQSHARHRNTVELYLLTEDAQRFFETQGFKAVDRQDAPEEIRQSGQFSLHCPDSATLMRKCLIQ